jgi:hypothetical protein
MTDFYYSFRSFLENKYPFFEFVSIKSSNISFKIYGVWSLLT